jgi:hypothetical protein
MNALRKRHRLFDKPIEIGFPILHGNLPNPSLLAQAECCHAVSWRCGYSGYLVKAAHDSGRMMIEPSIVTAAFVPIAALAIWWTVRRIRKKNIAGED